MFQESEVAQADASQFSERHVFVYGTLRRGGSNDINLRRPAPRYVGAASVYGMLYDLGPYPGLILVSADSSGGQTVNVLGEVYAVSPALENNLDELEGLLPVSTGEYFKRFLPLNVAVPSGSGAEQALLCIVYEINPARTQACALVESGDWIAHCAQKELVLAPTPRSQG